MRMKYPRETTLIAAYIYGDGNIVLSGNNIVVKDRGPFNPTHDTNNFISVLKWAMFNGYIFGVQKGSVLISTFIGGEERIPYVNVTVPYNDNDTYKENIIKALGIALDRGGPGKAFREVIKNEEKVNGCDTAHQDTRPRP